MQFWRNCVFSAGWRGWSFKVVLSRNWVMGDTWEGAGGWVGRGVIGVTFLDGFFYGNSVGGSSGLVLGWIYVRVAQAF